MSQVLCISALVIFIVMTLGCTDESKWICKTALFAITLGLGTLLFIVSGTFFILALLGVFK